MSHRQKPWLWASLLTLVYFAILAARPHEAFFGVPGEWTWSGRPPAASTIPRWWPAILILTFTVVVALALDKRWSRLNRWQRAMGLGFLIVVIPLTQILLIYIHNPRPIVSYLYRTIGPHNGFWQIAVSIDDLGDYLRTYPAQMRAMDGVFVHLTTHPPGTILYLWLWRRGFEAFPGIAHTVAHWLRSYNCADLAFVMRPDAHIATALGQMSLPLLNGLTVLPLYAWGKRLGGRQTGWRAATLFALLPALSLFTMRWDTVYPFFAATAFVTLHRGLDEDKPGLWFLAGSIVSLASFCSFGNAPLAPGLALYAGLYLWKQHQCVAPSPPSQPASFHKNILRRWRGWLALLIGGYSVWGIFHILTGVPFWELLAITSNIQITLRDNYSYGQWLFYNAYDVLVFTGVPVGMIFVVETARAWSAAWQRRIDDTLLPDLVISGILAGVNLAGVSPGEVGRLWMFWMTGTVLTTALWLRRRTTVQQRDYALWLSLMALQCLWLTLFLRVSHTGMPVYTPRQAGDPTVEVSLDVTYDQNIRLVGYALPTPRVLPGETLDLTLYWQAQPRPDLPYSIFAHFLDAEGALQAQNDGMPVADTLPTSCWLPGEIIEDHRPIAIPADTPPGDYAVQIGLYYLPTLTRLPIIAGAEGDAFRLPLEIAVTYP